MKSSRRLGLVAGVTLLVVALAVGCAPKAAPTPAQPAGEVQKPEYITIVYNSDVSGPLAALSGPGLLAWPAVTDYINNELGGVYGVEWRYELFDTQGKVDACLTNFTKIKEMKPKPLGMSVSASSESEALLPLTREAKMPTFGGQSLGSLYPVGYQFSTLAIYPDKFGYFVDWLVKNWDGAEPPKVAFLSWDNSFGRGVLTDEVFAYAEEKGVDIVAQELFAVTDVDVTTQLTRIKAVEADWIYSNTAAIGAFGLAKQVKEMGLDTKVVFCFLGALDLGVIAMDPEAAEGTYSVADVWSPTDYTHPGVKLARDYFEQQGKPESMWGSVSLVNGWSVHLKFYDAIKMVVDEHGWENLDGKHVKEAMETFRNRPILDGVQVVTYTPDKHSPDQAFMAQIQNGKHVNIEDGKWHTMPDLRPAEFKP